MKKFITLLLLLISTTNAFALAKIQNEDIKSLAQVIAGGGSAVNLPNDSKIYLTNPSLAVQLSAAIASGDIYSSVVAPIFRQIVTPANPGAGFNKCYTKADNKFYCLSSAGVESLIGPVAGITGTPSTFAGYDSLGNLYTIPNWTITAQDGVLSQHTVLAAPATTSVLHDFFAEVSPAVATVDFDNLSHVFITRVDNANLGNNLGGTVNNVDAQIIHNGTGHVGEMNSVNISETSGLGAVGSGDRARLINAGMTVNGLYSLTDAYLAQFNANIDPLALVTNFHGIDLTSNGPVTADYTGAAINYNLATVGGNYVGVSVNQGGGNIAGNATGLSTSIGGDIGTRYNGINAGLTGNVTTNLDALTMAQTGTVGGTVTEIGVTQNGAITGGYNGLFLSQTGNTAGFSGVNVSKTAGIMTNAEGYKIGFGNGAATSKSGYVAVMGDGVSTGSGRLFDGSWGDGDYNDRIGFQINGGTGDTVADETGVNIGQSSGTSANFTGVNIVSAGGATGGWNGLAINAAGTATGAVNGLNVSVLGVTTTTPKSTFNGSGGGMYNNSLYDTSIYPASPGTFFMNTLGGNFTVAPGFPMNNTFGLGVNLGAQAAFQDDMGPDAFGGFLGFSDAGFVGNIAVAAGKTVDTFNGLIAGMGVSPGGGSATNVNILQAAGFLGNPADLTVTNMTGLRVRDGLCDFGTNCWGVSVDDALAKNLFVGSVETDNSLILQDPGAGVNKWTIQSPVLAGDFTLTLPVDDGAVGQVLSTNGAGVTSWVNAPTAAYSIVTKIANYTATNADDLILVDASAGPVTISLHDPDTATPKRYSIKKIDSSINSVTIDVTSGDNIDGEQTQVIGAQNQSLDFVPDTATDDWYML